MYDTNDFWFSQYLTKTCREETVARLMEPLMKRAHHELVLIANRKMKLASKKGAGRASLKRRDVKDGARALYKSDRFFPPDSPNRKLLLSIWQECGYNFVVEHIDRLYGSKFEESTYNLHSNSEFDLVDYVHSLNIAN